MKHLRRITLCTLSLVAALGLPAQAAAADVQHLDIATSRGTLRLTPIDDNAIRVQLSVLPSRVDELVYTTPQKPRILDITPSRLVLKGISAEYDATGDALTFRDGDGRVILSEVAGGRSITPSTVQGDETRIVSQRFVSPDDEFMYGTGQFQDGILNVRGLTRRLTQVNTQIAIPMVTSSRGYALLWNNYGLTDFNPSTASIQLESAAEGQEVTVDVTSTTGNRRETRRANTFVGRFTVESDGEYAILLDVGQRMARKHNISIDGQLLTDCNNLWLPPTTSVRAQLSKGEHTVTVEGTSGDRPTIGWRKVNGETEFSSPVATGIDYTVFAGSADQCIASYRRVSGGMPMMPRWALGYIHCRERYNTQQELLENANEFRRRGIPVDVIVQDWQWWGKYGWNAMRFDEEKYPDPKAMIDSLHGMDMRLMLSVWSKIDMNSELGGETAAKGYYIPGTDWIDFFSQEAADFYWQCSNTRLQQPYGIDALWQDATEPENDDLLGRRVNRGQWPGELVRNVYPLVVNTAVYNGWMKDIKDKRPMILTRSGCPGISRYGVATWSGDVGNDWQTLRRQLVGGLGQMAAGLPWWTFDAGGFFRPGDQYTSTHYHELLVRWVQLGAFLPLMRVHGYMSQTEPWRYGERVEGLMVKYINLRRSLMPYIYSVAARVSSDGYTLMRPLVMDFADDAEALRQEDEYMFGPSILVAPVLESCPPCRRVYLPRGAKWYDWWTHRVYEGGQYVMADASLDKIPLFVRAGSIIPTTDGVMVYAGQDARFDLYEDDGVSMQYANGSFAVTPMVWRQDKHKLETGRRKGRYNGMGAQPRYEVKVIGE